METTNSHRTRKDWLGADWQKKLLVILITLLALLSLVVMSSKVLGGAGREVKRNRYQALFLTNGQVYFGKLSGVDGEYVKIKDIYYLQVQQQVQPGQKSEEQPQVSLAKLGGELHGPEDTMYVSRDQVLFWENLKDDGKVAKAIKDHQKQ